MSIALSKKNSTFGAMMMVTGCCIGAGMIGLPVLSAVSGFLPSALAMLLAYVFTTSTGLLLLEATLWFDRQVNLISIAQLILGRTGKFLIAALFLFLFYGIFVAYFDGGGQIFSSLLHVSKNTATLLCAGFVSLVLYTGTQGVVKINRFLMIGLAVSYLLIIGVGLPLVEPQNLTRIDWVGSLATLPILFICFGYQNLVPSLTHYLQKNTRSIRFAIIAGNFIPLLFYILWNFTILGISPDLGEGKTLVTDLLATTAPSVLPYVTAFCAFALFTSFITVAFSFQDFLRDAFQTPPHDLILQMLVLVPPLFISLSFPNLFLQALSFAGGFIDVLLFGIFPICIVWAGRYKKKIEGPYRFPGGRLMLLSLSALCLTFLCIRCVME